MSNISKGDILSPEEISIIENLVDLPISGEGEFMRKISSDDFLSALPEAQSPTGNYLSSVSTDATLTGIGTVGDPLSVVDEGIYALLLGRAGGQTLIGGTASGEDLTLQSTSDATKGKILFGTSAYDEVNNRLGIGTTSPNKKLNIDISGVDAIDSGFELTKGVGYLRLVNGGSGITSFAPTLSGKGVGLTFGLLFNSLAGDAGTSSPVTLFRSRNNAGSGSINDNQTAFGFENYVTRLMSILGNGNVGIGTATPNQKLTIEGTQSLKEQSNANADTVGYGQIWIKNETPNELWFTDDGGNDVRVGAVGTDARTITLVLADGTTDLAVEDGIGSFTWTVPIEFNGWDLILAHASVETAGVTGVSTFQIHNVTQTADMLSTKITIDTTETTSYTAATPPVIDAANDNIATGDKIRFDVDGISTTAPKGLQVILTIKKP